MCVIVIIIVLLCIKAVLGTKDTLPTCRCIIYIAHLTISTVCCVIFICGHANILCCCLSIVEHVNCVKKLVFNYPVV